MNSVTAYPLSWPVGWPRTRSPQNSRYSDKSVKRVHNDLEEEVRLLGGVGLVVSSNIQLQQDGRPRSNQRQPDDRGVAIYFTRKGQSFCFACDRWAKVEENLWAVCLTIKALRQLDRTGVSDMLERAFTGFLALPAPNTAVWYEVLGVAPNATQEEIERAYKQRAKATHPDTGGNHDDFIRVQSAYEEGKRVHNNR